MRIRWRRTAAVARPPRKRAARGEQRSRRSRPPPSPPPPPPPRPPPRTPRPLGGFHRVDDEQHGDGHGADAARHGRDGAGHLQARCRNPRRRSSLPSSPRLMPTSITTAPRLIMSPVIDARLAGGHHQHVGAARMRAQVRASWNCTASPWRRPASSSMAMGLPTILLRAHHDRFGAAQRHALGFQHLHHAVGRAGPEQAAGRS